jgi:predicted DNA-binding transcriptional regulator AlpA
MRIISPPPADAAYMSASQVKARFGGVNDMWILRKTRDAGFPAPRTFGSTTRYWTVADVIAWEAAMLAKAIHEPPVKSPNLKTRSQLVAVADDGSTKAVTPPVSVATTYRR